MQQLTMEQVKNISGGECTAARVANSVVIGAFSIAGGIVGAATGFGIGAIIGGGAGRVAGALAWEGMRDETIAFLCE